jgi:tetratricopeptide (TPR) repeat protein
MSKLFISYAHADSEIVTRISKELQEAGHEVWIDLHGIQGGTLWGSEIAKAIISCDILLLFLSSRAVRSDYVRREVDIAFDEKRKILPVMLEKVEIPVELDYQLAGIQYIDYQAPDWKTRLMAALGTQPVLRSVKDTGKLKNPYSSLPVLEPIERILILSNREMELKKAVQYLEQHRLLLLTGMPGIGKSTFARALLEFLPAGSPPPFWYNFERQRSSGNSLSVLLDHISSYLDVCLDVEVRREVMAFRNPPGGTASVQDVDVLISFLNQDVPIWLVFDNLETVLSRDTYEFLDEGLELLFDSLKTSTHNAKIIVTNPFIPILRSGELFLEAGTSAFILEGLNDDFTFAFLRAFGLQDRSKEELEPLIREINGHPFVLNHIARYIQAVGSGVILENLPGGLEEINERFGDFLKEHLSSQEFRALQSLTVLNRDLPMAGLCQIAQVKPNVMMRLREKGLLQANEAGKFWLHNIVRNSLKPTEPDFVKRAHLRAMNFHRNQELPLSPQSIDGFASVLEWHHHAVEAGDAVSAYAALCSTSLKEQLIKWNEYDLLVRLCEATFTAVYQVEANVSQVEANLSNYERINVHHTLGIAQFLLGDFSKSITQLQAALNLLPPEDKSELRIKLLLDLSESYNGSRDYEAAMDLCQQAADLLTNTTIESLQAKFLHLRGIIHRDQGDSEIAATDLEAALKLYEKSSDQTHIANITGDLGIVYYFQNLFEEAIRCYRQAVTASEANHDLRGAMIGHFNIGDIYLLNGKNAAARQELETALELARKKKIIWMEVDAGLYLTDALIGLSELDRAQQTLDSLRTSLKKRMSRCSSGLELTLNARLHWKKKNFDLARTYYTRAFELLENTRDCQYECGRAYIPYAEFMVEDGKMDSAEFALQKGNKIFRDVNNQLGLEMVEQALSNLHGQSG